LSREPAAGSNLKISRRYLLLAIATGVAGVLAGNPFARSSPRSVNPAASGTMARLGGTVSRAPGLPPIPRARPGKPGVVDRLPPTTNGLALTIDDGYDSETVNAYVDFCRDSGIRLTFNPNGVYGAVWNKHAQTLRPLIASGQVQIGNHTYYHRNLVDLSSDAVRLEIAKNEAWIERTFGITSRPWFRPPYGAHDERTDDLAGELGFTKILMWNATFGDSQPIPADVLLKQADRYLRPGSLLLGHANHRTITHLYGDILDLIRGRNLAPVTLDDIFGTTRAHG